MYVVQNEHLVQSDVVFLKLLWMQAASKSYHGAPNSHNNLTRNPCLDGDVAQKTWEYHVCVSYTCGYNHYNWNHIWT